MKALEIGELDKVLAQANAVAKKHSLSRTEALLLLITHETICLHFHVDEALEKEVKKHADGKRKK